MAGGDRKNGDPALIAALASGATVQDAARTVGVSERTVYRRRDDPEFARRVAEARAELVARAVALLADAGAEAAATLRALLGEPTPPAVRLGACRAILELGAKLRESEELERRIAALEEQTATPQRGGTRWAS